jgi:hypothetical protein
LNAWEGLSIMYPDPEGAHRAIEMMQKKLRDSDEKGLAAVFSAMNELDPPLKDMGSFETVLRAEDIQMMYRGSNDSSAGADWLGY